MKCRILVPIGCRSDEGLSAPVIKRLKEDDFFEVIVLNFSNPNDLFGIMLEIGKYNSKFQNQFINQIDLIFITGDRMEMAAAAFIAFHNNVPIAHYFAGVLNDPLTTLDDVNRHCISLWSDIQFVESKDCLLNLEVLFNAINKKSNCHIVGITHLEDLEIDESLVPKEEYDLFLLNPTTMKNDSEIKWEYKKRITIVIGPNPDPNNIIWKTIKTDIYYNSLPRPQFLGLLKKCKRFITNSSAAYYEAPHFLKKEQIIQIGDRNKNRTKFTEKPEKLASEKIVEILKNWWRDKFYGV